jgi:hypothetical protein
MVIILLYVVLKILILLYAAIKILSSGKKEIMLFLFADNTVHIKS